VHSNPTRERYRSVEEACLSGCRRSSVIVVSLNAAVGVIEISSSANAFGSMLRMSLDRRRLDVVSSARTFTGTGAHRSVSTTMSSGLDAWRVTEPMAKFSREMGVVVEAAG
jgi:hypothetical protein